MPKPLTPHPDTPRLTRAFPRCLASAVPWSGIVYRSASPAYSNRDDLVTGTGSKITGGRWNPPGHFAVVYACLDPHAALDEVLAHYRHYRLPLASAMPRVVVSLEVHLIRVLDLTQGAIRNMLKVSEQRMLDEPWREIRKRGKEALTQALGRLAWEAEWEGVLVPSAARKGCVNLLWFPGNLNPPDSWVKIINRGSLPLRIS